MCELHDIFYLGCRHWGANPEVRHMCSAAKVRSYHQHYGCHDRRLVGCMSASGRCRICARYKGVSWQKPQQHSFTSSLSRSSTASSDSTNSRSGGKGFGDSTFSAVVSVSTKASTSFTHVAEASKVSKRGSIRSVGSFGSTRTTLLDGDNWRTMSVGSCQCAGDEEKCGERCAKDDDEAKMVDGRGEDGADNQKDDEESAVAEAAEAKAYAAVEMLRKLMPWMGEETMRKLFVAGTGGSCADTAHHDKGGVDVKEIDGDSKVQGVGMNG